MSVAYREIFEWVYNLFTIETITAISVIVAVFFGVINIWLLRKSEQRRQDSILFNAVTSNLDDAITKFLDMYKTIINNRYAWAVLAEQLSAFHNLGCLITDKNLRKCYCGKLHFYVFCIRDILDKVDDYRFFYGILDYQSLKVQDLLEQSYKHHSNISPNVLDCLSQFILLFDGVRADYMFQDDELNKILQPVYVGFKNDTEYSDEQIKKMPQPFRNIYTYINEWTCGVQMLREKH